ncbi:hypothetical protein PtA15_10A318 [Puccinia triticina]|uniref:Uncharacterized protein n=1 Tax=Puccinia triticina TaxID=208348 RepID=A0ABY7CUB8_9BASI|nr:uncharacterized protein PtA15_10A318 [Puccinia triticina]WAQ88896.1 hypothetical protein PtA15_10A318 [Puccinia triticina]
MAPGCLEREGSDAGSEEDELVLTESIINASAAFDAGENMETEEPLEDLDWDDYLFEATNQLRDKPIARNKNANTRGAAQNGVWYPFKNKETSGTGRQWETIISQTANLWELGKNGVKSHFDDQTKLVGVRDNINRRFVEIMQQKDNASQQDEIRKMEEEDLAQLFNPFLGLLGVTASSSVL